MKVSIMIVACFLFITFMACYEKYQASELELQNALLIELVILLKEDLELATQHLYECQHSVLDAPKI